MRASNSAPPKPPHATTATSAAPGDDDPFFGAPPPKDAVLRKVLIAIPEHAKMRATMGWEMFDHCVAEMMRTIHARR